MPCVNELTRSDIKNALPTDNVTMSLIRRHDSRWPQIVSIYSEDEWSVLVDVILPQIAQNIRAAEWTVDDEALRETLKNNYCQTVTKLRTVIWKEQLNHDSE